MLIYLVVPLMLLISSNFKGKKYILKKMDVTNTVLLSFCFFVPFIIFAFRDESIGVDTRVYCYDYSIIKKTSISELIKTGYTDYEALFILLCKLLSYFFDSPLALLVTTSFIINFLHAKAINDLSINRYISIMLYFFISNFLYNLNIMRQAIAVGFLLFGLKYLLKKEYRKYIMCVLFASGFHIFAIAFLLFILPVKYIKTKKQLLLFIVLSVLFLLFSLELVHLIVQRYFYHFDYYFRNNYHSEQRVGITSIGYIIIDFIGTYYILKNFDSSKANKTEQIIYPLFLVMGATTLIMMSRFGIYERISRYFHSFLFLSVPYSMNEIKNKKTRKVISLLVYSYAFMFYLYLLVTNAYIIVPFVFWGF